MQGGLRIASQAFGLGGLVRGGLARLRKVRAQNLEDLLQGVLHLRYVAQVYVALQPCVELLVELIPVRRGREPVLEYQLWPVLSAREVYGRPDPLVLRVVDL